MKFSHTWHCVNGNADEDPAAQNVHRVPAVADILLIAQNLQFWNESVSSCPARQFRHGASPALEILPAVHGTHSAPEVDDWPALQFPHAPPAAEDWPAGQLPHAPPELEDWPAGQLEQEVNGEDEVWPALHAGQPVLPAPDLNVPAVH